MVCALTQVFCFAGIASRQHPTRRRPTARTGSDWPGAVLMCEDAHDALIKPRLAHAQPPYVLWISADGPAARYASPSDAIGRRSATVIPSSYSYIARAVLATITHQTRHAPASGSHPNGLTPDHPGHSPNRHPWGRFRRSGVSPLNVKDHAAWHGLQTWSEQLPA